MKSGEQKNRLEYVDDLTGLYNRRYFRERLLEEKRKADQKGSSFGLAMIDLDNFKPINDLYGHLTGDRVLSQVGELLKESLRPSDLLCRYAGDEFVVILPDIEEDDLIRIAERIKENFARASWRDDKGESIPPVTCSLGYSFYSETGKDLDGLVGWADQALYVAKHRGGNGYCGEKDLPKESIGLPLMSTPHIVGRDQELRQLKSVLEEPHAEERKLILIHGEAGVGKTRMVRELRQIVERSGGIALLGDCHEETRTIPYYPFREAFNRFFDEKKDAGFMLLKSLPEYSQRELARILPRLKDMRPSELERASDSFRLFEAVRLLLQELSTHSEEPLLFVVEDLHWSDEASLDLLHYLVRNLKEARVLLCGTYRTEEKEKEPGLLRFAGSLRRERLSEEMPLEPLSAEGVSAMVRLLYPGTKVPQNFQDFLYQKTEGNPFFVEELVKLFSEQDIGRGLPKIPEVPLSIYAVLQRRMDSLAVGMKEILACGALVGEVFEFEVLRRVQDSSQREILDAMEAGVKAHIVRESFEAGEELYRFVHSLMADVLYSGIGKVRRRLWHRQVGEALEEVYAGRLEQLNGRLAYHFERAEEWEKGLNYAVKSATQAKEDYANQEAIRLYDKARVILHRLNRESDAEAMAIAENLGDTYQIVGDYEKALEEYRFVENLARERGDEKKEADALFKMSSVDDIGGNYDEAMTHAQVSCQIRQKIGYQRGVAVSLDMIGSIHSKRGDYEDGLEYYEKSLSIRKDMDDKKDIAISLENIGTVCWHRGDYVDALKYLGDALKIRREIKDRMGMAVSLNVIGNVHWSRGDYDEALKCHEETLRIRKEMGFKRGVAGSLTNIGNVHWGRGDYGKALECHEESLKIDREVGHKRGVVAGLTNIGNVHWARGDYDKALTQHKESLEISREMGDKMNTALSLINIGDVHVQRGDYNEALKSYEESLAINRDIGEKSGLAFSLWGIGNIHQGLYDVEGAMKYHEDSFSLVDEMGMKTEKTELLARIGADHHLSGNTEKALEYLLRASQMITDFGTTEAEPEVLSALSEAWLGKGDSTKANESCERLLTTAGKEGLKKYLAIAKRIKGELLLSEIGGGPTAELMEKAATELKEARSIAEEIGALPLLWQIHGSLGALYKRKGDKRKATEQFKSARKIIREIASKVSDEKLKNAFLNSDQVQSLHRRL